MIKLLCAADIEVAIGKDGAKYFLLCSLKIEKVVIIYILLSIL